jgi:hypothetical protein
MRVLADVTLLGIDCVDIGRLAAVANLCQRSLRFGEVKLLTSIESRRRHVVRIPHIGTLPAYSHFMLKELSRYVDTPHVLIIQYDGFVLKPEAWDDRFLEYDYIGAPWFHTDGFNVGNGGFSLRSRRLLDVLSRDPEIVPGPAEDDDIGRKYRGRLERAGLTFAPEDVASRFSFEGNRKYGRMWNGQFGFHSYRKTDLRNWPCLPHCVRDWPFFRRHLPRYLKEQAKWRLWAAVRRRRLRAPAPPRR